MQHKHVFDKVYMERTSPDEPAYFVKKCKYCPYTEVIGRKSIKPKRPTPNGDASENNSLISHADKNKRKPIISRKYLRWIILLCVVLSVAAVTGLILVHYFHGSEEDLSDSTQSESLSETQSQNETTFVQTTNVQTADVEMTSSETTCVETTYVDVETSCVETTCIETANSWENYTETQTEDYSTVNTEQPETTMIITTTVDITTQIELTPPDTEEIVSSSQTTVTSASQTSVVFTTEIPTTTLLPETTVVTAETTFVSEEETSQEETLPGVANYVGLIYSGEEVIMLIKSGYDCIIVTNNGLKYRTKNVDDLSEIIILSDSYTCNLSDDGETLVFCQF